MVRPSMFVMVASLVGVLLAAPAFADIAPPDSCAEADVGKACDNATAGTQMDQPGVCQKDTCSRTTGSGTMSYDCFLCKATPAKKSDGGCSTSGPAGNAALLALPLLALGLLWNRRRRHN